MKDPLISVIMSVYNEPIEWIREAIDSILQQTYKAIEFIIICDNPGNSTIWNLLCCYVEKDSRVIAVLNESNVGLTKSLNRALDRCNGSFIARMDADDISLPNRLEKQVAFLQCNCDVSVCYSNYSRINEDGKCICPRFQKVEDYNINYITYTNPIGHSTVMFKSDLCQRRKPLYNEKYRRSQDYELWSFLYINDVKFGFIDEQLLKYRVSNTQVTCLYKSNQDCNLKQIRKELIKAYLVKKHILNSNDDYNIPSILSSINHKQVVFQEGDAFFPIVYMLYYSASKQSYIYAFEYVLRGLLFKYGFKKTLYIFLQPLFRTKWDNYLI